MSNILCGLFWLLVPFIVLGVLTDRLLETPTDRIHRWRAEGCSWAECARRAGVTVYRVRKLVAA